MSRHSEGQHNRKLHKIDSSQVGVVEEPILNNGWHLEQGKQTDSVYATNGIKPAKEIRSEKQEKSVSKASSCLDQHVTERSANRSNTTHEGLGHNIERLKEVVKRRLLRLSIARKSMNTGLRASNSVNDLSSFGSKPVRTYSGTEVRCFTRMLMLANNI